MRSRLRALLATLAAVAVLAISAATGRAECAPSARSIFPASGVVGTTVNATVAGDGLAGATVTVFGEPGLAVTVQTTSDTSVSLNLVIDASAAPGERILSLSTGSGIVAVDFTVNPVGGPVVTGVAPSPVATQGFLLALSVSGQGFGAVTTENLSVSGTGVDVITAAPSGDGTQLDLTLTVAVDAEVGTRALVLSTPLGGAVLQLYVTRPAPRITSVSPGAGEIGTVLPLTIRGENLTGAALVITSGASGQGGVVISEVATPDDTTLNATLTVSGALSPETEARLLIVTTESGQATTEFFVVAANAPTVTTTRPAAGERGQTVAVTLRGLNFTGATLSTSSGSISLANAAIVDDETATVDVTVAAGATINTNHTISVTTGAGTGTATFRVIGTGAPFYSAVRPPFGNRGTTVAILLDGVNLSGATGVSLSPSSGIVVSNVQSLDSRTVRALLSISPNANIGNRDLTVTTNAGSFTKSQPFRLNIPGQVPTISDVSPNVVDPGTTTTITVTGSNFAGAWVTVGGAGATVTNVVVDPSFTSLTFDLTLAEGAAAENRPLLVVTEDGTATCGILSTAEIELRAPLLVKTGAVVEAVTPGYRLFLFEFSMNERFDSGLRTFRRSSGASQLTLTRLDDLGIARAVRWLPFGFVRVRAVTATNQIATSQTVRFRR